MATNWADLIANYQKNVDWRLPIRHNRSLTSSLAIHGGAIEPGTSEVASGVAATCRHNYYSLEGIRAGDNSVLSIVSTAYDEPQALTLIASQDYCFSFHGVADQSPGVAATYVGGLDTVYRDAVISSLTGAGFTASIGDIETNANSALNIANKTRRAMGVQIEMTDTLRKSFFTGNDYSQANRETGVRTETYYSYVKAISAVANSLGGGASQTSQYQLNLATPLDAMSDFETWVNFNWEKLRKATAPPSGTTLPQSGPYKLGDRFYKTDTQSIYILVCKDANWGWHWRPVQDAISPWLTVPATAMNISGWTFNPVAANPFAIAFDNRGKCYWRGVIGTTVGNFTRNTSHAVFKLMPDGLRPRQRGVYMLGHETLAVGTDGTLLNSWQGVRVFVPDDPGAFPSVRGFGGTSDFNRVHLTGINYSAGTGKFWTP